MEKTTPTKQNIFIPNCRYYGLFAISKTEPNLIYGYVENSFSMGWSKHCANVWPAYKKHAIEKMAYRDAKEILERSDKDFIDFCKRAYSSGDEAFYKEGMPVEEARQKYLNIWIKINNQRYGTQSAWNDLSDRGIWVPEGFETKVFRLDSKNLPVVVDLRYRTALNQHKKITWDKWYYRNAHFWVKALNPNRTFENTGGLPFNIPKDQYNGSCKYIYGINCPHSKRKDDEKTKTKNLSRSEFKKLKHQKECKSIAEKGSPEVVGASPEKT